MEKNNTSPVDCSEDALCEISVKEIGKCNDNHGDVRENLQLSGNNNEETYRSQLGSKRRSNLMPLEAYIDDINAPDDETNSKKQKTAHGSSSPLPPVVVKQEVIEEDPIVIKQEVIEDDPITIKQEVIEEDTIVIKQEVIEDLVVVKQEVMEEDAGVIKQGLMEDDTCHENKLQLEEGEIPSDELEEGEIVEGKTEMPEVKKEKFHEEDKRACKKDSGKNSYPIDYGGFNRKRKVALLLAYCGKGFHGMQKNPDVVTIELRLLEALAAIQAIHQQHKTEFLVKNNNMLSFNRAARTDKGVSAARQVVSMKLKATESFLEDVNKHLPKEIRVFGLERVTKSFDAKCSCSGRCYEYLVPTVAFAPSKDIMDSSYRLSGSQFKKVNEILQKYVGTHNFHNYTSGKRFTDESAVRYITEFKAGKPFECRGHEFMALEVKGQSFLMHQIRKMIGICIAICRGYCSKDIVDKSWKQSKLDIPKAPGLGLLLNRVLFKAYDNKFANDGTHNPLTFESAELEVERYKIEYIWHNIIEEEIKKSSIIHWLKTLSNHTYTEAGTCPPMSADYVGKDGVFPRLNDPRRFTNSNKEPVGTG